MISENSQSQRPTVVEEESKREEEDDLGFTKEELQEAEEIREKEVDIQNEVFYLLLPGDIQSTHLYSTTVL